MADISTAVSMARVPILGENGRISDDYIPAAIGEGVESAEAAAKRAETAATAAEGSATAAGQSAAGAQGSASAAGASATQAQQSAAAAGGAATKAQSAQQAAEAAKAGAESARGSAQTAASQAQQSATAAAESAANVADKFISSAQATTLEPGSQATASVADQVLTIGVPKGDKGDTGDKGDPGKQGVQGEKGDPGTAATIAVGSVTGLAAGASPTVVNSGTANAAVLDFGIPKGDKGEKGDPGTGVPDGGTPGQLLSKTDSGTAWVDPPSGNVLTGTATGYVAHAEDAYAQKPIEVRVKGKTWVNRWPVINTSDGTVTTDEIGLITINATPEQTMYAKDQARGVAANKAYTLLVSNASGASNSTWAAYVEERDADGTYVTSYAISASKPSVTFTTKANCAQFYCMIIVHAGYAANLTTRIMLVDGTEAPDCFTPPASIASVQTGKLVTAGKNLANAENVVVGNGGTVTNNDNSDGSFDFNVTSEGVYAFVREKVTLTPGTYKFSAQLSGSGSAQVILNDDIVAYTNYSFTVNSTNEYELRVVQKSSIQGTVHVSGWQLELGSTATAYEPPTVTQTPLPEVELRSLPNGTCDELVIKADGTCVVERRTQLSGGEVTALPEPITEPQSPVTLPALPAPTFNQYHDSPVPSDTSTEYARDINLVLSKLQAQISATTVREATNG